MKIVSVFHLLIVLCCIAMKNVLLDLIQFVWVNFIFLVLLLRKWGFKGSAIINDSAGFFECQTIKRLLRHIKNGGFTKRGSSQ